MKLTRKEVRGIVVVSIHGKLFGGPDASDKFHQLFKSIIADGKKYVVVDLHRTSNANSLGIGMLIGAYTSMRNAGGDLVLACVIDRINGILIVTQLALIFKTFDTVDEAVDHLLKIAESQPDITADIKPETAGQSPKKEKPQHP